MASYHATIQSPMTPEESFDYLADFSTAGEWDANTVSSECISGEAGTLGAKYEVVTRFAGREMTLAYETVEYDRPKKVVLKSGNGTTEITDTMTFTPSGPGTKVTYNANIAPKGLVKLIDPLLALIFKRVGDNAVVGLREALGADSTK